MVLCCIVNQEDLCTTRLLGKPLIKQVLASIGRTTDDVFIIHDENSTVGEAIHEIDDTIHCLPVKSKGLTAQIKEALELAESLHILKDTSITFFPLEYLFTFPVLPMPSETSILCHTGRVGVPVSVESGKISKGDTYVGSILHFETVKYILSVCSNNSFDSWSQFIEYMLDEEEELQAVVRQTREVFSIATTEERSMYEAYIHRFVFALDGVVANFSSFWYSIWANTLAKFNLNLTNPLYSSGLFQASDEEIANRLGLPLDILQTTKQTMIANEVHNATYTPMSGFDALFQVVKQGGHTIQIYSSLPPEMSSILMDHLQLPKECLISTLDDISEQTVVFASQQNEIDAAKGAKWIVGYPSYFSNQQLIEMGVDAVIQNFESPETIVQTLLIPNPKSNEVEQIEQIFDSKESIQLLYPQNQIQVDNQAAVGNLSYVYPVQILGSTPITAVAKITLQDDSERTRIANLLDVYSREEVFYDKLARYVGVRVPRYFGALKDKSWKSRGILLEDIRFGNEIKTLESESIDTVLRVVSELARLHAQFWENTAELPLSFLELPHTLLDEKWAAFETKWSDVLGTQAIETLRFAKERFQSNAQRFRKGSLTFLHGDVKSSNIFFNVQDQTPGFLDWQFASVGKGVQDLVFFMIESFSVQTMDRQFTILKQYYYTKLREFGIEYSWTEYEEDFKAAVEYYPLFVAVWYGAMDSSDLLDKNFPFFYLQRYVRFLSR